MSVKQYTQMSELSSINMNMQFVPKKTVVPRGKSYDKEIAALSKIIEAQLRKEAIEARSTIKLLLLGTSECGKSTVLKQMRILHSKGFSSEELQHQKSIIFTNILNSVSVALDSAGTLFNGGESPTLEKDVELVSGAARKNESRLLTPSVWVALRRLWENRAFQLAVRSSCQDSVIYFLENLERISASDYEPSQQDVLYARSATTGVIEVRFKIKGAIFRVIDVGGQRSERKKWIHCFEDVEALIFMTAVSDYAIMLEEDESTNRLHESLVLFKSVINCTYFVKKDIILFLNKIDLFKRKIEQVPLTICFPNFNGTNSSEECATFIETAFCQLNALPNRTIFCHHTCATDTTQVKFILDSVFDIIIEQNTRQAGLTQ